MTTSYDDSNSGPGWPMPAAAPAEVWFFTFGPDHRHPTTGESLGGRYVAIEGDIESTRAAMFAVFGNRWAQQYRAADKAERIDQYGLIVMQMDGK